MQTRTRSASGWRKSLPRSCEWEAHLNKSCEACLEENFKMILQACQCLGKESADVACKWEAHFGQSCDSVDAARACGLTS
eukprot:4334854-Amphidinium_carterae.1